MLDHSGLTGITFDQRYLGVVPAGHLARESTNHHQRRRPLGAVLQPEPAARRDHPVRPGGLRAQRHQHAVSRNAPAGLIYPGDPGFPDGATGLDDEVDELRAARGHRLGRARRRPTRDQVVVRSLIRLPNGRVHVESGGRSAVRQPRPVDGSPRQVRRSLRPSAGRRSAPDRDRARTPSSHARARLRPSIRASTRRASSRGTSRSSSSSGRTGRRRRATWAATPTGSGDSRR